MKKTLAVLMLAAAGVSALPDTAFAWACYASSRSAYGWGRSYNYSDAKVRALAECAVRTPRWQTCYVQRCRR